MRGTRTRIRGACGFLRERQPGQFIHSLTYLHTHRHTAAATSRHIHTSICCIYPHAHIRAHSHTCTLKRCPTHTYTKIFKKHISKTWLFFRLLRVPESLFSGSSAQRLTCGSQKLQGGRSSRDVRLHSDSECLTFTGPSFCAYTIALIIIPTSQGSSIYWENLFRILGESAWHGCLFSKHYFEWLFS